VNAVAGTFMGDSPFSPGLTTGAFSLLKIISKYVAQCTATVAQCNCRKEINHAKQQIKILEYQGYP
jgi:hypothetical protein